MHENAHEPLLHPASRTLHGFGARVTSTTEGNFSLLGSPQGNVRTLRERMRRESSWCLSRSFQRGVLLFTKKALAEKRDQIQALYRAYDEGVDEVNARPDAYRDVIVAG